MQEMKQRHNADCLATCMAIAFGLPYSEVAKYVPTLDNVDPYSEAPNDTFKRAKLFANDLGYRLESVTEPERGYRYIVGLVQPHTKHFHAIVLSETGLLYDPDRNAPQSWEPFTEEHKMIARVFLEIRETSVVHPPLESLFGTTN